MENNDLPGISVSVLWEAGKAVTQEKIILDLDLDSTVFIPWDDSFREIQVSSSLYKKYKKYKGSAHIRIQNILYKVCKIQKIAKYKL